MSQVIVEPKLLSSVGIVVNRRHSCSVLTVHEVEKILETMNLRKMVQNHVILIYVYILIKRQVNEIVHCDVIN